MLSFVFSFMFKNQVIDIPPVPAPSATAYGILLGIFIPIAGSIVPIQTAMNKQLNESLTN
jgi:hypothetical protein